MIADGRCAITITTGYLTGDVTSPRAIRDAAEELIHTCVSGGGGRATSGGVAEAIGMYRQLKQK